MRETTEDRHQPMKKQLILLVKNIQPHATFSNNQRLKFSSATIWRLIFTTSPKDHINLK
jgi:hypothetical protein